MNLNIDIRVILVLHENQLAKRNRRDFTKSLLLNQNISMIIDDTRSQNIQFFSQIPTIIGKINYISVQ